MFVVVKLKSVIAIMIPPPVGAESRAKVGKLFLLAKTTASRHAPFRVLPG